MAKNFKKIQYYDTFVSEIFARSLVAFMNPFQLSKWPRNDGCCMTQLNSIGFLCGRALYQSKDTFYLQPWELTDIFPISPCFLSMSTIINVAKKFQHLQRSFTFFFYTKKKLIRFVSKSKMVYPFRLIMLVKVNFICYLHCNSMKRTISQFSRLLKGSWRFFHFFRIMRTHMHRVKKYNKLFFDFFFSNK